VATIQFFTSCVSLGGKAAAPFAHPLDRRLIPAVPFIADDSSHCGPSALAAVLSYYGRPTTKEEVAADVQRLDLRGALGPDLVLWARNQGFEALFKDSSPEEVVKSIDALRPVILLLDEGFGPVRKGHFVVAVGYSPEGLVVNSGEIQQQLLSWSSVLTSWLKLGNFAIFVSPPAKAQGKGEAGLTGEAWLNAPAFDSAVSSERAEAPPGEAPSQAFGSTLPPGVTPVPTPADIEAMGGRTVIIQSAYPVPPALAGADLPVDRVESKQPVISFVGAPMQDIPKREPPKAEGGDSEPLKTDSPASGLAKAPIKVDAASPEAEAALAAEGRMVVVSGGIEETDLAPPKKLPVVPIPEDDPLAPTAKKLAAENEAAMESAKVKGSEEAKSGGQEALKNEAAKNESAKNEAGKNEPSGPFETGQRLGNPTPARAKPAGRKEPSDPASAEAKAKDDKTEAEAKDDKTEAEAALTTESSQVFGNPARNAEDPGYAVITTSSGKIVGDKVPPEPGFATITTSGGQVVGDKPQDAPTPPGVITLSPFLLQDGGAGPAAPSSDAVPVMGWERKN
jgi:hypothetical protein